MDCPFGCIAVPWILPCRRSNDNQGLHVDKQGAAFIVPVALKLVPGLMGKPKDEPFTDIQEILKTVEGLGEQHPDPEEYNFFGVTYHTKNIATLLKSNPFFATALTERRDGFELRDFDPRDPDCKDSSALHRKHMGTFAGVGHRVNVRFNSDMNRIVRITFYDDLKGKFIEKVKSFDEKDLEYYASSALYNLLYYLSRIHATIHVLQLSITAPKT